jgi:hypothetical protein
LVKSAGRHQHVEEGEDRRLAGGERADATCRRMMPKLLGLEGRAALARDEQFTMSANSSASALASRLATSGKYRASSLPDLA